MWVFEVVIVANGVGTFGDALAWLMMKYLHSATIDSSWAKRRSRYSAVPGVGSSSSVCWMEAKSRRRAFLSQLLLALWIAERVGVSSSRLADDPNGLRHYTNKNVQTQRTLDMAYFQSISSSSGDRRHTLLEAVLFHS